MIRRLHKPRLSPTKCIQLEPVLAHDRRHSSYSVISGSLDKGGKIAYPRLPNGKMNLPDRYELHIETVRPRLLSEQPWMIHWSRFRCRRRRRFGDRRWGWRRERAGDEPPT